NLFGWRTSKLTKPLRGHTPGGSWDQNPNCFSPFTLSFPVNKSVGLRAALDEAAGGGTPLSPLFFPPLFLWFAGCDVRASMEKNHRVEVLPRKPAVYFFARVKINKLR